MMTLLRIGAALTCAALSLPGYAAELVTNGDFSAGLTGFTTTYGMPGSPAQGSVLITTNPDSLCGSCFISVGDHTTGTGNMLFIDGAESNTGAFWSQTFDVATNSDYVLSLWASNAGTNGPQPVLRATINGVTAVSATVLPYGNDGPSTWRRYTANFASGAATSVTLSLFDDAQVYSYNDFVIDDISFQGPAALSAVPEPATWAMMIAGFGLVGGAMRRRATPVLFS